MSGIKYRSWFETSMALPVVEILIISFSLFVLEGIYVLGGLNHLLIVGGFLTTYLCINTYLVYTMSGGLVELSGYSLVLGVFGIAVIFLTANLSTVRGPLFLLLFVGSVWAVTTDRGIPPQSKVSLAMMSCGLAVLIGAFPHVGSNLVGTPRGTAVSVRFILASEDAVVFGIWTPAVRFVASTIHAEVHLFQLSVGAIGYALGRNATI